MKMWWKWHTIDITRSCFVCNVLKIRDLIFGLKKSAFLGVNNFMFLCMYTFLANTSMCCTKHLHSLNMPVYTCTLRIHLYIHRTLWLSLKIIFSLWSSSNLTAVYLISDAIAYISHNLRTNKLFINSIEMMHGLLGFLLLQSLKNTGNLNGNS